MFQVGDLIVSNHTVFLEDYSRWGPYYAVLVEKVELVPDDDREYTLDWRGVILLAPNATQRLKKDIPCNIGFSEKHMRVLKDEEIPDELWVELATWRMLGENE